MSSTLKVILGIIMGALLVCLAVGAVAFAVSRTTFTAVANAIEDSFSEVAKTANDITDFDLPADFDDGTAIEMPFFKFVSYTGADDHSHVYFIQADASLDIDEEDFQKQINQNSKRNEGRNEVRVIDEKETVIAGQTVTVTYSEGINSDNQPYRTAHASFEGREGTAFVMFERPTASWDQAEVDAFFASIRN